MYAYDGNGNLIQVPDQTGNAAAPTGTSSPIFDPKGMLDSLFGSPGLNLNSILSSVIPIAGSLWQYLGSEGAFVVPIKYMATLKQAAAFRESNLKAARIIAADPERYPAGSLLAIWAELVLNPPATSSGRPDAAPMVRNLDQENIYE